MVRLSRVWRAVWGMGHPLVRWSVLLITQHGGMPAQWQGDGEGIEALPLNWVECGNSYTSSAMIRYIGTDPRKSALMPRAISLRSRVLGNWQARFWRPVERGDPSAEFNQSQGHDLAGPEVGLGVFGDGVQLLIDLIEQCGDKLYGHHTALLASQGCHASQRGRVVGRLQAQKLN